MGCGICHFFFGCLCSPAFLGRCVPPGFPGCFDGVAPNPRILRFDGVLSRVFFLYSEFISGLDALHTVPNSGFVHTLPIEQASTAQQILFSWGHDPYTLACKARPSFDRCWTSLSVSCPRGVGKLKLCRLRLCAERCAKQKSRGYVLGDQTGGDSG